MSYDVMPTDVNRTTEKRKTRQSICPATAMVDVCGTVLYLHGTVQNIQKQLVRKGENLHKVLNLQSLLPNTKPGTLFFTSLKKDLMKGEGWRRMEIGQLTADLIRRKIVDLLSQDHLCVHLQCANGSHGPTRATTTLVLSLRANMR